MKTSDRIYDLVLECQAERQSIESQEPKNPKEFDDKNRKITAFQRKYRVAFSKQLSEMQSNINKRRAELLRCDAMIKQLARGADDFVRYASAPDARLSLAVEGGSKRDLRKREPITDKEQCYNMLSGGELAGDDLKYFLTAIDA